LHGYKSRGENPVSLRGAKRRGNLNKMQLRHDKFFATLLNDTVCAYEIPRDQ